MDALRFADELRRLRMARGLSYRALAERVRYAKSYLEDLEKGRKPPHPDLAARLDEALGGTGRLVAALRPADDADGELEATELARRVAASDVGTATLVRLDRAVDALAAAYATTPPGDLLPRVRRHLDYAATLIDARKTLTPHRRLLVVGGWLALLRATLHVDLRQDASAAAYAATAAQLAAETGHAEIAAWCLETRAWAALTAGEPRRAAELARGAQAVAPVGGSAVVQATAQEGRAAARLGERAATRRALARVERLAGHRAEPDQPEHHFRYDPRKAHAYTATTLAWIGDPAAVTVARDVVAELERDGARPRRTATARLDLALALLGAGEPDGAAAAATAAITSGRLVGSTWWRAREVVAGIERTGAAAAADLRELADANRPVASG